MSQCLGTPMAKTYDMIIALLEPLYEETENPVFACIAWMLAVKSGRRPAKFALDYFTRCAVNVVESLHKEKRQPVNKMFEFTASRG